MPPPRRPGLAKVKRAPLFKRRVFELWQSTDYHWRELFERADVMSEGATVNQAQGDFYFGTTSVLLRNVSSNGGIPDDQAGRALDLVARDPHARLRAIRIACREALVRANGSLGRIRTEVSFHQDNDGVRIDIDVEAPAYPHSNDIRPEQKAARTRKLPRAI